MGAGHEGSAFHADGAPPVALRRAAVASAGHLGDADQARSALVDPDPSVRATALGALVRLGAATPGEIERLLQDPSPLVRRRAAEVAWRTGLGAEVLAPIVARALDDPEPEVVEAACFCLGELRPGAVAEALSAVAVGHSDPLCRESAVAALGAIGEEASLGVILQALADRPPVRRRAVIALAGYSGEEVDAALAKALEDRDWQVRQAAEDLTGSRPRPG